MSDREALARELELLEAALARRRLLWFVRATMPGYEANWHHEKLAAALDDVYEGRTTRLAVFMPPQSGKTELVSRRFPAYVLGRNPNARIVTGTYNAERAKEVSGELQRILDDPAYRRIFPGTRLARAADVEERSAWRFQVVGHAGVYQAAGVGQGIAGKSMDIGIIDDPVKNRAEAESEQFRKLTWDWYVNDISRRQVDQFARIILVQTRWHEDDLAGRLLRLAAQNPAADQWRVISFPAICEQEAPGDPRKVGDALWPSRFSRAWLDAARSMGVYEFSALYQQRPVPPGGAMAQRAWFKIADLPRGGVMRRCRCWDLAGTLATSGRDPDWTVGARLAQHADGSWTVEHVVRARLTASGVDDLIKMTAMADGAHTLVREWQDPGAAGKAVVEAHRRLLAGWDYEPLPSSGGKTLRWRPFLVQAEGGNIWVRRGEWTEAFLDELAMVPYALHDDQADAVAGAFLGLTQFKDYGPSVAVILPRNAEGKPSDGAWRQGFFK